MLMVYNNFGQLSGEYQEHSGPTLATTASRSVQYAYSSGTANTIRLTGVTYPSGSRSITFGYNSGDDDNLSRVSYLGSSGTLSQFKYLGLGQIVTETYPQPGVTLDYSGGTSASYAGLDNFGRVAQQPWLSTSGTTLDQFNYTYDYAGNRLYRKNMVAGAGGALDELYNYDHVYRLGQSQRGRSAHRARPFPARSYVKRTGPSIRWAIGLTIRSPTAACWP